MDTEVKDSLWVVNDALTQPMESTPNWWMYVAVIELVVILLLLLSMFKHSKAKRLNTLTTRKKVQDTLAEEVDFSNVINSSFHATTLYDKLIKKCHPDRFPNDELKQKVAADLSAEIGKNKHNIKKLEEIMQIAERDLNINI